MEISQPLADLAYSRIKAFPLTFIDTIDEELLLKAASLKASYPISYVDSFAAAMAKIRTPDPNRYPSMRGLNQ